MMMYQPTPTETHRWQIYPNQATVSPFIWEKTLLSISFIFWAAPHGGRPSVWINIGQTAHSSHFNWGGGLDYFDHNSYLLICYIYLLYLLYLLYIFAIYRANCPQQPLQLRRRRTGLFWSQLISFDFLGEYLFQLADIFCQSLLKTHNEITLRRWLHIITMTFLFDFQWKLISGVENIKSPTDGCCIKYTLLCMFAQMKTSRWPSYSSHATEVEFKHIPKR